MEGAPKPEVQTLDDERTPGWRLHRSRFYEETPVPLPGGEGPESLRKRAHGRRGVGIGGPGAVPRL